MHGGSGCGEISGWAGQLNLPNPFPPTSQALTEPNGLLAVGGDLRPETLISAYAQGIFPWFEPGQEILWWSPDPRSVLFPDRLHISRSLNKFLRKSTWRISCDTRFAEVVDRCASALRHEDHDAEHSTWISAEMRHAYDALHQLGVAHSIEIADQDQLLGGLYGVMLGNVFFGESMFSDHTNGSKVALIALARLCQDNGIVMIDCQVHNPHLETMGAELISRQVFEKYLEGAITTPMVTALDNPARLIPAKRASLEERLHVPLRRFSVELL